MNHIAHAFPADRRFHNEAAGVPVAAYVSEHEAVLWHAARLLGGYASARLVDKLADALRQSPRLRPSVQTMLGQLLSLLTLEHAHDPDSVELGFFAVIDPNDPVVEEICVLTDGLRDAIARSEALTREMAAPEPRAA